MEVKNGGNDLHYSHRDWLATTVVEWLMQLAVS